jgi:hypothetical protein
MAVPTQILQGGGPDTALRHAGTHVFRERIGDQPLFEKRIFVARNLVRHAEWRNNNSNHLR